MILPVGASRFEEALQMGSETYHHLKVILLNSTVEAFGFIFNLQFPCEDCIKFMCIFVQRYNWKYNVKCDRKLRNDFFLSDFILCQHNKSFQADTTQLNFRNTLPLLSIIVHMFSLPTSFLEWSSFLLILFFLTYPKKEKIIFLLS